ncbi:hypothetical protein GW7_06971 [Heterocephalus glaber]|uniref:Uncharacterized protein n=1 Tax=Heterocephalus glaber TaxID=10181 RepID=G5B5V8_HETGA|nr:hypothetical protein GW7_06971 [Heterocephalus glaber]
MDNSCNNKVHPSSPNMHEYQHHHSKNEKHSKKSKKHHRKHSRSQLGSVSDDEDSHSKKKRQRSESRSASEHSSSAESESGRKYGRSPENVYKFTFVIEKREEELCEDEVVT